MFTFEVVPDNDKPYTLKASARDVRKWEKETGKSLRDMSQNTFELSDAYLLAYYASVRAGKFTGTLDEFEDSVDFDLPELDEAPLATNKEA